MCTVEVLFEWDRVPIESADGLPCRWEAAEAAQAGASEIIAIVAHAGAATCVYTARRCLCTVQQAVRTEVEVCAVEIVLGWDGVPMGCLAGGRSPEELKRELQKFRLRASAMYLDQVLEFSSSDHQEKEAASAPDPPRLQCSNPQ